MTPSHYLAAAALALAVACSNESGGPADPGGQPTAFEAATARAEIDRFNALTRTDAMAAVGALLSVSGDVSFVELGRVGGRTTLRALADLATGGAIRADQFLSDNVLGSTLVFDSGLGRYTRDPNRAGAPANGVRLILYEQDESGRPDPAREIGWLDIIDDGGSAEGLDARLTGVANGATFLDYSIRASSVSSLGTIAVSGFIQGSGDRYDFDFSLENDGSVFDVDLHVDSPTRDFAVDGAFDITLDGSDTRVEHTFDVRYGDQTARLVSEFASGEVDAEVFVGGSLFATVSGDVDDPMILNVNGEPLSAFEALVLRDLVDLGGDLFAVSAGLLSPLFLIFFLSVFGGFL